MTEEILSEWQKVMIPGAYKRLSETVNQLELMADLVEADMFVDCLDESGTAIVVAQAKPRWAFSNYQGSAVGHIALREDEPAVYQAFEGCMPVKDLKAVTQEKCSVMQDVVPITWEGQTVGVLIAERDMTQEMRHEQKLRELENRAEDASEETLEKGLVYREMNHRIKNQLQLLSSTMRIRGRRSAQAETREAMIENAAKIDAVATVYDGIDPGKPAALLPILQRIGDLTHSVAEDRKVDICVQGDACSISGEQAVTAAMVVSELMINAVRHGFPGRETGQICVTLQNGNAQLTMTVWDNGMGFSADRVEMHGGMRLMTSVVREKLRGDIRWLSDSDGTTVTVSIPKKE
ncbi:MAG: hypothetical protein GXW99_09480 [Clostridiales bacterium]|nr:hypothetical protein [Clostridiales bacterium]